VFAEYHEFTKQYGSLIYLPTLNWFYGMQPQEEALIDLGPGKRIIVKYLYRLGPDANGKCRVFFELNGQTRSVDVADLSATSSLKRNAKVAGGNPLQVGSPLQGKLSRILVKAGDKVKKNQPLFVIEAMKMESNVVSTQDAKVDQIVLSEGSLVETDDLVVVLG
jgi:pyruvate carboxylase